MFGLRVYSSADFRGSYQRWVGFWHVERSDVCTSEVILELVYVLFTFLELNCGGYTFWANIHLIEYVKENILNFGGYIQENWIYFYVCSGCLDQKSLNKDQELHKCNSFSLNFWPVNPWGKKPLTLLLIFTYLMLRWSPWCAPLPQSPHSPDCDVPQQHVFYCP